MFVSGAQSGMTSQRDEDTAMKCCMPVIALSMVILAGCSGADDATLRQALIDRVQVPDSIFADAPIAVRKTWKSEGALCKNLDAGS